MRFSHRLLWDAPENSWTQALAHTDIRLDLTISNPTRVFDFSPYQGAILDALRHPQALHYDPSPLGLVSTREFLASALDMPGGVSPEDILLASSTSEGYGFLFKLLCDPGDEVLVPLPSYPLFEYLAHLEGVHIVPYRLEYIHPRGYEIDMPSLKQAISPRTRAIVAVHPNNPTGTGTFAADIASLDALAQRHHLALIVDEVFADYWIQRPADVPPTWWHMVQSPLFVLGGLSKSLLLPQMKLAWILFHAPTSEKPLLRRAMELIGDTYLSPSIPIQLALPRWWEIKPSLNTMVKNRLRDNLAALESMLRHTPCRLHTCHGGWSAVIEFPRLITEENLIQLMLSQGIKIYPGYFFDFEKDGHVVVSLLTPPDDLREGISTMLAILQEHAS